MNNQHKTNKEFLEYLEATSELEIEILPERDLFPEIAERIHRLSENQHQESLIDDLKENKKQSYWQKISHFLLAEKWKISTVGFACMLPILFITQSQTTSDEEKPPNFNHQLLSENLAEAKSQITEPSKERIKLKNDLTEAFSIYKQANTKLRKALDNNKSSMKYETWQIIQENLKITDDAIEKLEKALEEDVNNPELLALTLKIHAKRIQLLQKALQIKTI